MKIKAIPLFKFMPKGPSLSIQSRLLLLLLIVLLPVLLIQALIYYDRFHTRKVLELQANLELADAVGKTFDAFVGGILRQELAIAIAATASPPLSSDDFTRLLMQSAKDSPAVRDFHWVSPQGRILASSNSQFIGTDISDRLYFMEIVSGRDRVVSDLVFSKVTGELIFSISRGIRDENGVLPGLVVATILPDRLDSVLPLDRLGDAGVSLIDSKGMHVYRHPPANYTWEQRNWLKLYPEIEEALKGKEIAATVLSERTGIKRLVGFSPVSFTGWVAASSRAEDDAMRDIKSALMRHGGMSLGAALLSFLVAVAVSRTIARPIEKIHNNALLFAGGNRGARVEVSGPAELQNLACVLNYAAEEQKRTEETLRESERQAAEARDLLNAIIEGTPDLVAAQDSNYRYLAYNRAYGTEFAKIFGRDIRTGMSMAEALAHLPEDRKSSIELCDRALKGETFTVEHELGDPDRARNCYHMSFNPIRASDGRIIGAAHILRDITEQKRMEVEMRASRDELELRVQERTTEFIEANKRLEFRNQELEEFAFIASHDLQEPLRKIQTFASRLQGRTTPYFDEEGLHYLERMTKATERARDLINALLLYSRVTGKETVFTMVDMRELIEEVITELEVHMEESEATIDIGDLPTLRADRNQMRHLFRNLISNALKYRGDERPVIEIYSSLSDNGFHRICVKDNGIGFEEQYVDRIFKPFQRLVDKRKYSGTGIGLTICRKVVDRHGGTLTARSTPGKGSTFIVSLPAGEVRGA